VVEGLGRLMPHFDWQRLRDPWLVVAVAVALVAVIALGVLAGGSMSLAIAATVCLAFILIALKSPYVGLAIFLPSIAILPWDGYIRGGLWVPALIRLAAPALLCGVLLRALSTRMKRTFRLNVVDILAGALGLFGLINLVGTGGIMFAKSYSKAMLFPLFFYFIARLLDWDRDGWRRLLRLQLIATAVCALLIVVESVRGGSLLYRGSGGLGEIHGVRIAFGPFGAMWTAASFLCLWPPLFIYAAATAKRPWARASWLVGGVLTIMALTRTHERAMIGGAALALALCLLVPRLRKPLTLAGCVAVVVIVPVLILGSGPTWLIDRFRDPTKGYTRDAYNAGAISVLKSPDWNPILGVGYSQFGYYALRHTPPELLERAFGTSYQRLFERGYTPRQHNIALTLLVEFGIVGTALFVAVLLGIGYHWLQCFRPPGCANVALVVAVLAMAVSALFSACFHNLYIIAQATLYLWFFGGLIVGHKHLFRLPDGESGDDAHAASNTDGQSARRPTGVVARRRWREDRR